MAAAVDARFEDPKTVDFAELLPSVAELRRAAATLRGASLWSRLGRDWRAAKVIWRKTFPSERKIVPLEAARRLLAAALWKQRLFQLEANQAAKSAAGRYWRNLNLTRFDRTRAIDLVHDMLKKKQAGLSVPREQSGVRPQNVINLMDALKRSIADEKRPAVPAKKGRKRIPGQGEMLLPISGKKSKEAAAKPVARPGRQKKAG